ncbi:hypothetical protein [Amycolatopsis australiensis]|uniref:hypothetical protein n=1 Tax=Amycolatopsis australiensis TaxID=546364 RepID=UPI001160F175|nr:hypothetical protein [Amycolatopsis australiensis]
MSESRADEWRDERHALLAFTGRILSSWSYTTRMIALAGALLAILVIGIGVLRLTVDVGPLRVTSNSSTGDHHR